jgi:hypothetical protein
MNLQKNVLVANLKTSQSFYFSIGVLYSLVSFLNDSDASSTLFIIRQFAREYKVLQTPEMIYQKYMSISEHNAPNFYTVVEDTIRPSNSNSPKSFYAASLQEAVEFCKQNKIF